MELITPADIDRIAREELADAFKAIQQPRSDYQLENFVVGEKHTPASAYAQCVLEMQAKHQVIRRGVISRKKFKLEIERLRATGDEMDELAAQEKEIDLEQLEDAALGALREFRCLYAIFKGFERHFTYEEIQDDQSQMWYARFSAECNMHVQATGTIPYGHLDALRQAHIPLIKDAQGCTLLGAPQGLQFDEHKPALHNFDKAGLLDGRQGLLRLPGDR